MLKSYDELLDIAESKGLKVYEYIPLKNLRGFIYGDVILLKWDLTEMEKRAVLTEEITHYERDNGDITDDWRAEYRTRKHAILNNISLKEFLDAIIDNHEDANSYTISETLGIPEWMFNEIYEVFSCLPFSDFTYRGTRIKFQPLRLIPLDEF